MLAINRGKESSNSQRVLKGGGLCEQPDGPSVLSEVTEKHYPQSLLCLIMAGSSALYYAPS